MLSPDGGRFYLSILYASFLCRFKQTVGSVLPALGVAARKHRTEALYKMEGRSAFILLLV